MHVTGSGVCVPARLLACGLWCRLLPFGLRTPNKALPVALQHGMYPFNRGQSLQFLMPRGMWVADAALH